MKQPKGNIMISARVLLVLTAVLALGACSSPQVRFHTLMPQPGQQMEDESAVDLVISSVMVPAQVDRSELVVRKDASGLVVLSSDWWGASLAEELRSALVAGFGPGGQEAPRVNLRLQVTRFDSVPGKHAWLEARYQLTGSGNNGKQQLSCSARLRTGVSGEQSQVVEALVLAQQENVRMLAAQILAAARGLGSGQGCPAESPVGSTL
ncbi:membrane integrity-associated transporter subunit PqiC [Marinobacter sp.]|uniref:PqiC family protein n=1 Tax=Marinobacter sp. TaxID=50741 RepID=UPI00384D7C1C